MDASVNRLADLCRSPALCVEPGDSLRTVVQLLSGNEIGIVLVRGGDAPVGVVSERDVVRGVMLHDELDLDTALLDMPARDVMSTDLVVVDPETTPVAAVDRMRAEGVRHLIVATGDHHYVVSMRDLM